MAANRRPERAGFGRTTLACLLIAALSACGGGGDGDNAVSNSPDRVAPAGGGVGPNDDHSLAQALARDDIASLFPQVKLQANQCAPDNPLAFDANGNSLAPAGVVYQKASRVQEQQFIQTYMNEVYYWYKQMPAVDAAAPAYRTAPYGVGMPAYFAALKNPEKLGDGRERDRHSNLESSERFRQLMQSDASLGFGAEWGATRAGQDGAAGNSLHVLHVDEGSPAASAGLQRGDELLIARVATATGVRDMTVAAISHADLEGLHRFLQQPGRQGDEALLRVRSRNGQTRDVLLRAASHEKNLVPVVRTLQGGDGAPVGYLLVKAFQTPLEGQMKAAMERLKSQGVRDLVVDLRYNSGGLVYQSAQLAWMVADTTLTKGKVFDRMLYNDKRKAWESLPSMRGTSFLDRTSGRPGSGTTAGANLPNFGLKRVYVLTSATSCSSSEAFINGLRGADVEVVQVGGTTCGKPYTFFVQQNCGVAYLPVMAKGVNAKGFGDYDEGLAPTCQVSDDLGHALGDASEGMLAAALHHRQHGSCPAGNTAAAKSLTGADAVNDLRVYRHPIETLKIVQPSDFQPDVSPR